MITIPVTQEDIDKAENLYSFKCLNNSITGIYGAILKDEVYRLHEDYDMIVSGKKIDVKTTSTLYAAHKGATTNPLKT
jgi:hypothetical protein